MNTISSIIHYGHGDENTDTLALWNSHMYRIKEEESSQGGRKDSSFPRVVGRVTQAQDELTNGNNRHRRVQGEDH